MRGEFPLSYRGFGGSPPGKFLGNCGAGEAFLSLFRLITNQRQEVTVFYTL